MVSSRKNIVVGYLLFLSALGYGQSKSFVPNSQELTQTKNTHKKYLIKFIITNIAKRAVLAKGKRQHKELLTHIEGQKHGNFDSDFGYIEELGEVPPVLIGSSALKTVVGDQEDILGYIGETQRILDENGDIIGAEKRNIYRRMLDDLKERLKLDMTELESVIFENDMKFTDNERLEKMELLASGYPDKKRFAQMIRQRAIIEVQYVNLENRDIKLTEVYNGTD